MAAYQVSPSLGFSRQEHQSGLPFPSPVHDSEKLKWGRSVVSDSLRPHRWQPTRLLCPWDFPGKSTGVGCLCLLRLYSLWGRKESDTTERLSLSLSNPWQRCQEWRMGSLFNKWCWKNWMKEECRGMNLNPNLTSNRKSIQNGFSSVQFSHSVDIQLKAQPLF